MRWRAPGWSRVAAWLGIIALGLNALVPIHLAFDLAEALAPTHHERAEAASLDRQILALLCGHDISSGNHHRHHHDRPGSHHDCPVCAAAATLAALALPTAAAVPVPAPTAVRLAPPPIVAAPPPIVAAAYRSRAPPIV